MDISTGYESYVQIKPRQETCRKPTNAKKETRGRLTDAELLVLPPFGYDLLSRERFDKSFTGTIRRHRLEFLIYNKVVAGQQHVQSKHVAPQKLDLFSPKDMRREQREGTGRREVCRVLHDAFTPNAYVPLSLARPAASAAGGSSPRPTASAVGGYRLLCLLAQQQFKRCGRDVSSSYSKRCRGDAHSLRYGGRCVVGNKPPRYSKRCGGGGAVVGQPSSR